MDKHLKRIEISKRRTLGIRPGGRSRRVVDEILRATAEELGTSGYAGLRIEEVAARSGVNKTTIYRRWPKKSDLVTATMLHLVADEAPPDTGSLREDFLEAFRRAFAWKATPLGAGLMRMLQAERADPEFEPVMKALRDDQWATRRKMVARAIERGELPADVDVDTVIETVFGTVFGRMHRGEPMDLEFAAKVIDLVLAGAAARR
ncbi:MAG TPA: TetR/AcrR family transcriptional regulator [Haliangiales bacterium]|nr:TetR/AcrR family transcriptional regulator [Haliangiales bacterium]